jgi:hypothetical protein
MRDLVRGRGYFRPMSAQPHMIPSWRNTSAELAVHVPRVRVLVLHGTLAQLNHGASGVLGSQISEH